MNLSTLYDQYKIFDSLLVDLKVVSRSLVGLPDDLELGVSSSFEKDQPGGMIKDGMVIIPKQGPFEKLPKTVLQRRKELDREIQIVEARVNQIKAEMVKELLKKDE